MSKKDIKSLYFSELRKELKEKGYHSYRASQVYEWLHRRHVSTFDEMTNLPKDFRKKLADEYEINLAEIEKRFDSSIDDTVKYLFKLNDGEFVESVLMKYNHGYSICVSTQVGCKMGCTFCATGMGGFVRNLKPSEMIAQIQSAESDKNIRISNVVLMGMGEPLDNYDNVLRFLKLVSSENGLNIGMRHISVSTCGIVDNIYKLAKEKLQLTLSVSLHAPNDNLRNKLMPVNRRWGVDELLEACRYYVNITNRRISFEYAMVSGINDTEECAFELAKRLKPILCHVNLIPINSVDGIGYNKSKIETQNRFKQILLKKGLNVTVRRTLGSDINASCGQLRRNHNLGRNHS